MNKPSIYVPIGNIYQYYFFLKIKTNSIGAILMNFLIMILGRNLSDKRFE